MIKEWRGNLIGPVGVGVGMTIGKKRKYSNHPGRRKKMRRRRKGNYN